MIDCNLASGSLQVVAGGDFCGAADPDFYSGNNPNATEWDRSVTEGWRKRDHNWDFSTEIQHELRSNVGLSASWFHNTGGYFRAGIGITDNQSASRKRVIDNLGVTPADYDTYCFRRRATRGCPAAGGTKSATSRTSSRRSTPTYSPRSSSSPRESRLATTRATTTSSTSALQCLD